MDSLTQFTLGAAVGQVVLGKSVGRKAVLIGGLSGTIPDLDGIFLQGLDMVSQLVHHRGFSHSLVFCCVAPFILAYLCQRFLKWTVSFRRWTLFWFVGFLTHTLLDCFTSWGTQFFWPHPYRVAFHSIFIIDPFYTVPLLLGVMVTFWKRVDRFVWWGIVLSTFYLGLGLGVKQVVDHQFEKGLIAEGYQVTDYISKPTPFNIILWSIAADQGDRYCYGYYSLFDDAIPTEFTQSALKRHDLFSSYQGHERLQQLLFFTQGFYVVDPVDQGFTIYDARYGLFGDWDSDYEGRYVFQYHFDPVSNTFSQSRPSFDGSGGLMGSLIDRIM